MSMIFLLDKEWRDGRLNNKIGNLAEKVLKKHVNLHMLRHTSATYWAPKMNRYQLCAKYGWTFSSDMLDRYIGRKGIIFEEIAQKGDVDQPTRLQKENRILAEKGRGRPDSGCMDEPAVTGQRILGDEGFVSKMKRELFSHERERALNFREIQERIQSIVEMRRKEGRVQTQELRRGNRRQQVAEAHAVIAWQLVDELGVPLSEVAHHVGVSASAISKILRRRSFRLVGNSS
jgi:hypothetical protein